MADGAALAGLVPPTHFTTLIILLINTGLFAATLLASLKKSSDVMWSLDGETLYYFGAKESFSVLVRGQWWRLLTAGFLHGGVLHILMNSWALYDLGAQVEETYGTARFLALYLVSSALGFLASSFWSRSLSIGASAAIFGLIGAMIAYGYRNRGTALGMMIKSVYARWLVYGLLFSLMPGIDIAAHVGGLAAGFSLAYLAGSPGPQPVAEWFWRAVAALLILAAAISFLFVWRAFPAG